MIIKLKRNIANILFPLIFVILMILPLIVIEQEAMDPNANYMMVVSSYIMVVLPFQIGENAWKNYISFYEKKHYDLLSLYPLKIDKLVFENILFSAILISIVDLVFFATYEIIYCLLMDLTISFPVNVLHFISVYVVLLIYSFVLIYVFTLCISILRGSVVVAFLMPIILTLLEMFLGKYNLLLHIIAPNAYDNGLLIPILILVFLGVSILGLNKYNTRILKR